MSKPKLITSDMVAGVVKHHYFRVEKKVLVNMDGAQMWNGEWWMPLSGCDTLSNMLEDLVYAIEQRDAKK